MPTQKILMCRPDHYAVRYSINVHMDPARTVDPGEVQRQWLGLRRHVVRCGGWVEYVEAPLWLPDMVFTANAGLVHDGKFAPSKFRHTERQGEQWHFRNYFRDNGYDVRDVDHFFEGAGDAFVVGDTLFLGHGFRTAPEAADDLRDALGFQKITPCHLVNPIYYHLDTCFLPLGDRVLYEPSAFDEPTLEIFRSLGFVEVPPGEPFACNAVVMGGEVLMPDVGVRTAEVVEGMGYAVTLLPMGEFLKAGGACKCLTLEV